VASKQKNTYTPREISAALNNAVQAALKPDSGEIPEKRLRRLHEYTSALIEPIVEHMKEELLRPEEMVAILAAAALYTHTTEVLQVENEKRVPMFEAAKAAAERGEK
jgi:hypothetical protein